jgi:hypothetical protein
VVSLAIIRFLFASSFAQAARSRKACVDSFCWWLNAKAFSDWNASIVASNRAKVNDSEPVDAFGKVENLKSNTPVIFSGAEKFGRKNQKTAQRTKLLRTCEKKSADAAYLLPQGVKEVSYGSEASYLHVLQDF